MSIRARTCTVDVDVDFEGVLFVSESQSRCSASETDTDGPLPSGPSTALGIDGHSTHPVHPLPCLSSSETLCMSPLLRRTCSCSRVPIPQ
jgi:hypothetical protein